MVTRAMDALHNLYIWALNFPSLIVNGAEN
jgi:hypothetical protein